MYYLIFFFKQKTAYEMRISDWSSDVCSSDLKAVGDQLTAVFVDHGLLRKGEREQVENDYVASTGVRLITVDARERFLSALAGVSDPEIGRASCRERVC